MRAALSLNAVTPLPSCSSRNNKPCRTGVRRVQSLGGRSSLWGSQVPVSRGGISPQQLPRRRGTVVALARLTEEESRTGTEIRRAAGKKKDANKTTDGEAVEELGKEESFLELGIILVMVVGVAAYAAFNHEDLTVQIQQFADGLTGKGVWGMVQFGLLYLFLEMVAVPATPLTLSAGALFGVPKGLLVVTIAGISAASLGFLIGRHLISSKVEKYTTKIANWNAINRALSKGSFRVITLLRISPLFPFSISNYIYGLTRIKFQDYVTGSLIGMLPGTLWYVTVGKVGRSVLEADAGGSTLLQGVGLGLALLVSLGSAGYVTKLVKEEIDQEGTQSTGPPPR